MIFMTKIFCVLLICFFFTSCCGNSNTADKSEPKTEPVAKQPVSVEQSAPISPPPKISTEWAGLSEKISPLPSIGATREEFDKAYQQTNANSAGYIRYSQDVWLVQFFDTTGNDSGDKKARAYMVTI